MKKVNYKTLSLVLGLIAFSFLFVWYIFAFTEPSVAPPGGNVPAPLNVGLTFQSKEGALVLNTGGAPTGLIVDKGSVWFNSEIGGTPTSGPGARLMWIPAKRAFRAGFVPGTEWDDVNIGLDSIAMGWGTVASGESSVSIGSGSVAGGDWSIAIGDGSTSTGIFSISIGNNAIASGNWSAAIGRGVEASGLGSFSIGEDTLASGVDSFASGHNSVASGDFSIAMGDGPAAIGISSVAIGEGAVASGNWSTAFGRIPDARGDYSVAIGNQIYVEGAHSVGIGLDNMAGLTVTQPNTMAIMGGNVGIGTTSPSSALEIDNTNTPWGLSVVTNRGSLVSSGIYGEGSGTGLINRGVYGDASGVSGGTNYGTTGVATGATENYALFADATGGSNAYGLFSRAAGATTNYAIVARASGGTTNWAFWSSSGDVYIADAVGIGVFPTTSKLQVVGLFEYADNAAAIAGGLTVGAFYRTGDLLKVVH